MDSIYDDFITLQDIETASSDANDASEWSLPSVGTVGNLLPEMVLVNAWVGSRMPSYFPQFIDSVRRNPSLSFLMISTYETPEFCPADGSESIYFPSTNPRLRIHCSSLTDLVAKSSSALCEEWNCSHQELNQVTKQFGDFVSIDGQAWNNLKPVYATIFADSLHNLFPSHHFSHWIRVDLDLFIGNWERLFPSELLQKYDVFTFFPGASMDWQYIYLKGYVAGFRLSHKVNTLWKTMDMFKDPASFIMTFHNKTFTDPASTMAADEGAQTVNILQNHPEISFIVEPGLLAVDLDIAADRHHKIVYYGSHSDILRVPINAEPEEVERFRHHHTLSTRVEELGRVYFTQECDMSWLEPNDRLCIQRPHDPRQLQNLSSGFQVRISRDPESSSLSACSLPGRGLGVGHHALFYHAQVTKKHGLNYVKADPGDRIEISKDHESYWRFKRVNQHGQVQIHQSEHPWPGRWE